DLALDGRDDDRLEPQRNRQARKPGLWRPQARGAWLEPAEAERIRGRAARRRAERQSRRDLWRCRRRRQWTERTDERDERRNARANASSDHASRPQDWSARRDRTAKFGLVR